MAITLTEKILRKIAPFAPKNADVFVSYLNKFMPMFGVNTQKRVAAFLAQLAHESGSFRYVRELASGAAYEGNKSLGNTQKGDGKFFKGRGLIQITGRANYRACSLALFGDLRLLDQPWILESPQYAVASACWYWQSRGLNEIADFPDTKIFIWKNKPRTKFEWITIKINGGLNGLSDRQQFWVRAKKALSIQAKDYKFTDLAEAKAKIQQVYTKE